MEVPRRIELMPVAPIQKKETKKETAPTIRFDLDLAEPTEKTCPEFSYEELLRNALGPKENGTGPNINGTNPDDPFGDDADDAKMRALAQSFEAKYGGGGGPNKKSRKQRDRLEDLVDLGEGYDDEDSFIDNTEAYDELVPACLETKHGGFYINAGKLDFREIRSDSDDDFESPKRKKKKRKKMSINSDSEEEEKKVPPKKKFSHKNVLIKKRKKLSSSGSVDGKKPQKKVKLGADGLPKKRGLKHDKEKSRPKVKKTPPSVEELIQQQVKSTTTNNNQLSESTSNVPANETIVLDSSISKLHSDTSNHGESGEERSKSPKPETAPKIPDNVSPSLKENVEKIKEAAKASQESKSKFFNASVNKLLLGIETESQALPPSVRKIIYTHLAAFLPVGIQALTKRAKKLRLNEQDDKLKEPINRLREAIAKAMPEQMEKYNIEVKLATKAYQEKQQLLQQQKQEQKDDNPATVESDDEKKDGDKNAEMKRFKAPNKKFQWTEGLRMLLCSVVRIKMNMFDAGNSKTQSAEEFLRAYLDTEVKPLWPQGWMQTRMLYKESKNAHNRWTSGPVQPKPPKKPMISESGVASVNSSQIADTSSSLLDVSANTSVARTPASKEEKPLISHPTPTLLDYATKSYYSAAKSKVASTPAPKSELSGASQGTPITTKSITTPAVTPVGTSEDGGEALRSMSMLAGLASSRSPSEKPKEQATTPALGSSPPSLTQKVSTGFMPDQSSDFMAQFREFAKSFQQESRDSPPVLNLTNSSQISALKQAWDQASKTKENKSKLPADQTVTKVKLQSRTVNVVKVKPKQTSGVSTITTDSNSPQTSISTGDKSKGNFTVAGSVSETPASSVKAAPFAQQNVTTPPVWSHGTSFADTASGASKMQENKHRLQGDQREKLTQLAMKTQIAKPTEKKRQQIQQSHSQEASVTNMSKSLGNGLFSPPSSSPQSLHSMHSSQTVKPSVGPVTSQVPQQQLHKHPMQQQTPRTSPSPNRNSPVTPPRSSPGSLYNSLALLNQAQMQAQTLQQQQRTAAPTNSQTMWRSVDQTAKASRSPNSSSAFTLPSGLQRSPAAVASDFFPHQARNTNSGTSGYPGIHMVDLSKAQQAHDIAASMRSPSSPAHTGPGLYSPSLQNQGVGSLNHHSLLGSHTSPQAHRAQSLYSGVHRGSPIAPGTPPFSSHPYADPGQQYH